jgi:hypothetical protein
MERAAAAESRGAGQIISDSIIRKTFKLTKKKQLRGEKAHQANEGAYSCTHADVHCALLSAHICHAMTKRGLTRWPGDLAP